MKKIKIEKNEGGGALGGFDLGIGNKYWNAKALIVIDQIIDYSTVRGRKLCNRKTTFILTL